MPNKTDTVKMTVDELNEAIAKQQGYEQDEMTLTVYGGEPCDPYPHTFWKRDGRTVEGIPDYCGYIVLAMPLLPNDDDTRVSLDRVRADSGSPWRGQMVWRCSIREFCSVEHKELSTAIALASYQKATGNIIEIIETDEEGNE